MIPGVGHLPPFLVPTRAFDGLVYPHPPRNLPFKKKKLMPGGCPGGGMGTAGID